MNKSHKITVLWSSSAICFNKSGFYQVSGCYQKTHQDQAHGSVIINCKPHCCHKTKFMISLSSQLSIGRTKINSSTFCDLCRLFAVSFGFTYSLLTDDFVILIHPNTLLQQYDHQTIKQFLCKSRVGPFQLSIPEEYFATFISYLVHTL